MNIHSYRSWKIRALASALAIAALIIGPSSALAADFRSEPTAVSIGPGVSVDDDLYTASQTVNIQGTVNGNVFAAGNMTTISGTVNGDVFAAGNNTTISGRVTGTVYAAGGTVIVAGPIGKDLFGFGGTVQVQPGATVGRDAIINGGNLDLAGSIGRNLRANGGQVLLGGSVGGNVEGNAESLRLGPGAAIQGNLTYTSREPIDVAPGSVGGTVTTSLSTPRQTEPQSFMSGAFGWLRTVVGLFALGLLLVLLVPGFTRRASDTIGSAPWVSLGSGVALLVAVPFVAVLALILGAFIGGWWLALGLLALYALTLPLGYVLASLFVASFIAERGAKLHVHTIWLLLAGVVVVTLVGHIPYVGPWLTFAAVLFGFGAFGATLVGGFGHPPAAAPEHPFRPMPVAA